MKKLFYLILSVLFLSVSATFVAAITNEEAVALVEQTAMDIEENALQTLARINRAEHPYKNKDNPSLYVFVLDTAPGTCPIVAFCLAASASAA